MVDVSRRGFLRGRSTLPPALRPPWAGSEADFAERCTRCGDCLPACPQAILAVGSGGYPTVDFRRGECTFCGACAEACRPAALLRRPDVPPWRLKAQIAPTCLPRQGVECRICGDFCDARAIRFPPRVGGAALAELDPDRCTGCGACVAPCPVGAISVV